MMKTIVEEKLTSFKELEQKVFKYVCELCCEITRIILENYEDGLQFYDKRGISIPESEQTTLREPCTAKKTGS